MPHPQADKLIVTNLDKLTQKYQAAGAAKVKTAIDKLIAADAGRGIVAKLIDLSDAATMSAHGGTAVSAAQAGDAKRNKQAIDAVFTHYDPRPAYLMLVGSIDVIPHVPLDNPMGNDGDADVPSDLPYACSQPYSTDPQHFIAPTRVVGRLPNVTGDTDPQYLIGLLSTAATYTKRPTTDYNDFLAISAQVWQKSSELSINAIFGTQAGLKVSPTDGYKWTAAEARRLSHFVNCHGAPADPMFYGQKGKSNFPVAHSAAWMSGKLAPASVMSAECCYGAELYDPVATAVGQMGICNTYLGNQGYAYFGSSTIAYGPPAANDLADLLCQTFLLQILAGASAGRACLQARLDYVMGKGGTLTPTDLKTIVQFSLMGDPSLTPVAPQPHSLVVPKATARFKPKAAAAAVARHSRQSRRAGLVAQASATRAYRLVAAASPPGGKSSIFGKLKQLAASLGIKAPDEIVSYSLSSPRKSSGPKSLALDSAVAAAKPKAVHVIFERTAPPAKVPHLRLVRGVQAIEYPEGMEAQEIVSR